MAKMAERLRKRASEDLDEEVKARPGAARPAAPNELLALQQAAGNRAVLARLAAPKANTAALPTVQRRAMFNKAAGKWISDLPALLNQKFESKAAAEKAEQTARAAKVEEPPKPVVAVSPGDGAGFTKVKTKAEERQEAREAVDTDALSEEIDGHTGAAKKMAVPFSQLVNALEAQNALEVGTIQEKYYDGAQERAKGAAGKWSVAVSIGALDNWEIHAHCDLEGNTASGDNPIHIKRVSERYSRGVSIGLTPRQERLLIPPKEDRLAAAFA